MQSSSHTPVSAVTPTGRITPHVPPFLLPPASQKHFIPSILQQYVKSGVTAPSSSRFHRHLAETHTHTPGQTKVPNISNPTLLSSSLSVHAVKVKSYTIIQGYHLFYITGKRIYLYSPVECSTKTWERSFKRGYYARPQKCHVSRSSPFPHPVFHNALRCRCCSCRHRRCLKRRFPLRHAFGQALHLFGDGGGSLGPSLSPGSGPSPDTSSTTGTTSTIISTRTVGSIVATLTRRGAFPFFACIELSRK